MHKHGLEKESTGDSWAYNPRLRTSPAVGSKMRLSRRWFTGSVGLNPCRGARDHEYINESRHRHCPFLSLAYALLVGKTRHSRRKINLCDRRRFVLLFDPALGSCPRC